MIDKLKVHHNAKGQFTTNQSPASIAHRFTSERMNQYAKGNPPNKTVFTPAHNQEQHACWKGGLQRTRDGYYRCYAPKKRMPNARYIYEQANGYEINTLPKNYVVIHLDGNKYNDSPDNLQAITRAENMKRNAKH